MTGLDPIDNGFGRHTADLAGLENGQYVFHMDAPFRFSYYSYYSYYSKYSFIILSSIFLFFGNN
jgi:hypothetical protein